MGQFPVDKTYRSSVTDSAVWLLPLVVIAIFHVIRAQANPSPIYGGDEYAYLANGLFRSGSADLWQRDPYLQRIVNPLFLFLIDHASRLFPDPIGVVRAVGALAYLAMTTMVGWFIARSAGALHAVAAVVLAGLLPSSGYAAALMPEPIFFAAAVSAVLASAGMGGIAGAIVAGGFTSIALLLKPHAISLLLGIAVARLAHAALLAAIGRPTRSTIASLLAYVGATYALTAISSSIFFRRFLLDPRFLLGDFYVSAVQTSINTAASGLGSIFIYFLANTAGVMLLACPFVCIAVLHTIRCRRDAQNIVESIEFPLTVAFVALATIAMVSIFTHGAGSQSSTEAFRLHGRYYAYLYILVAVAALRIPNWRSLLANPFIPNSVSWVDGFRIVGFVWLAAVPACLLIVWRFQILPWDNPEFQAFYRSDLAVWNSPVHITWFAIAAPIVLALGAVSFIVMRHTAPSVAIIAIGLVFVMSSLNNTRFQYFQIASSQYLTEAGRFARDLFPRGDDAHVAIIGTERYGAVAYVLFGMGCKCHVRIAEIGKPTHYDDLPPGVRYVFSVRSHPIDFSARLLFQAPAGSFYQTEQ